MAEASDGPLMENIIPQVLARGITLDAIGLDMQQDHSLATKVHNYRRAEDKHSLTQAIAASFAEVGGDDQAASDELFAELAGLDANIAAATITAYAQSGNQAISARVIADQGDAAAQVSVSNSQGSSKDGFNISWLGFICIFIAIIFIKSVIGKISKP